MNLQVKMLLHLRENYINLIYRFLHFYAYNTLKLSILYLTLSSLKIGARKEVEIFLKDINTWKLTQKLFAQTCQKKKMQIGLFATK
eukprot:UN25214